MPQPKHTLINVDEVLRKIKEAKVEETPISASGNLTGITYANARSTREPEGYYKKLNDKVKLDIFSDRSNWEDIGRSQQTNLDVAFKTFYGGLINFAAGAVENLGANDLKGIYDMSMGNIETHYGNVIHDFANYLREKSEKNFHIYNDKDNSIFNIPYWGKQLQNFTYSGGIISEGFLELGLASAIVGPEALTAFGPYQGLKEAYINALQTGEEIYKKYIDIGYNEKESKEKANKAATLGFRREVIPLMLLNGLQFALIRNSNPFIKKSHNFGFSGAVETGADKVFKDVKNKYLRNLSKYVVLAGSESMEEAIQTGISKTAQYDVKHASGLVGEKQIEDIVFDDDDMKDSMIGGALGGIFFGGMGHVFNKLTNGTRIKQQKQTYNNFLQNSAARVRTDTKDLKEAFNSGDQDKIDVVRKRLQRNNVFEALKLDLINQNESAFNTYVSILQEINTAAQNGDVEKLKSLGVEKPEDVTYIKENYQTFINDAHNIKKKLIENLKVVDDYNVAVNLTNNEKTLEELNEFEERSKNTISKIKSDNKQYSKLTSTGKRKFDLILEQTALFAKSQKNQISPFQKEKLNEITQELKIIKEENKNYAGKKSDERIINNLKSEKLIDEHLNILEFQHYQDIMFEKIKYWKNPINQKKEKIKIAKKKIEKVRSTEDFKKAKEELKQTEALTPESEEIINDKIEQLSVKDINNPDVSSVFTVPPQELNQERSNLAQEITSNVLNENDFSHLKDQELFESQSINNITPAQKAKLKSSVADYYESMKSDINKKPIFQEFVKDFIKNNNKQTTDKIYNALVEGWKANNYKEEDFDKVYDEIFKDRKQISADIINIAEDIITEETKDEIVKSNEKTLKETVKRKAPVVKIDDYNNRPEIRDDTPYITSSPALKAAFLSSLYTKKFVKNEDGSITIINHNISKELNDSKYINDKKLLNPDLFNPGTILTVKIPENYKEILIATWEDDLTKGQSMTFDRWMKINKTEESSEEAINKIPMIAYDKDGDGVFFMHDTEWYNFLNVGFKDDPKKQSEIITKARKKLKDIRKKVYDNKSLKIKITVKRPGTWKQIEKNENPITLNEANPKSQLAIGNGTGDYLLNGKEIFENKTKKISNKEEPTSGHVYDIRRSITSNTYIAFKVLRETINPQVINTVKEVVKAYLYQYDTENIVDTKTLRKQVLKITGLDIFDREDFENFINLYIPTIKGKFHKVSDIISAVESNNNLNIGTPFISIQNGKLVFGTKGNKTLYLHPQKINDPNGTSQMVSMLSQFEKLLPRITQHVSKKGLAENRTTITINETGTVIPGNDYRTFLKDNLKTNVKSFNVGTKEKPVYATIVQPVINFEETEDDWQTFVNTGKVSKNETNKIAQKIRDGESLTSKEEAMRQEASEEIETKLKETEEEITEEQIFTDAYKLLIEMGANEQDESIKFLKEKLSKKEELGKNENYEPVDPDIKALMEQISGTNGLSIIQDFQIVDYVFNQLSSKIDFEHKSFVNKENLLKEIKLSFFDLIEPKKKKSKDILSNLKSLLNKKTDNSKLKLIFDELENNIKIFDIIKNNWSDIENKALEKLYKYTGIEEGTVNQDDIINETIEKEKNYSKSSLEENGKLTSSYRLRRFLAGVNKIDPKGKIVTGFLGVPTYTGFDTVYSTIEQILSSPYEIDSDFELMMTRLEENTTNQKWLEQVIEKLKVADNQIKNEFTYNFAKHTLSMKFVMFSKNRNDGWTLRVYNTNANEIIRVIRKQWKSNFKQSPLVFIENGQYKINKERAKYLLKTFNSWQSKTIGKKTTINASNSQLQSWLGDFGIYLSDETLDELKNKEIQYITNEGKVKLSFDKMFRKSPNTAGIFGLLANYLENTIKKSDTNIEENNDPFNNANNIIKILAKIESKYASYTTTNSFRDGDKSIYSFTLTKHATDAVKSLKFDPDFRLQLNEKSFNKHSFWLKLLNESDSFRENFHINHLGITAIKQLGKKVYTDNSITALSPSDHELTKLGLFQDLNGEKLNKHLGKNDFVNLRMARMFLPTMSDKSQILLLHTAVLDLKNKHFIINENGDVKLSPILKEIVYSQIIKPELERIVNFNSTIKKTDIKGYDTAAQMFLFVPELNNLFDPVTNKRVISLMRNAPAIYNMEWFEDNFKQRAKDVVSALIKTEVKSKIKEWERNGFIKTEDNKKSIQFLDKKYFNRLTGPIDEKIKVAVNDYVINSLLANANSYMLIAGDIAMYSQDKIKSYFQNGKPYLPKEQFDKEVYAKISKEIIGANASKRLGSLLAPGNKLANSKNSQYKQVFLNDYVDISSNTIALVKMFYGEDVTSRIEDYKKDKTTAGRKVIAKELSKKYPLLSDYFEIEATDSQEYTTLSEHINVLWGQGRLTDTQYKIINDKIKQQLNAESENKEIPKSAMLNYAEMKLVFQPTKPVHTGFKNEDKFDVMRMIYIKSSSFPLIPQVTLGTELDNLRKLLENYEKTSGKFVRASYGSANKVGATINSITPFLLDGTFNHNISIQDIDEASLTLNRDNFRIQQDVPFKSDKKIEDNVSLGTQTLKLLFGDGILDINDFEYNNKKHSGKELHSIFNTIYNKYIVHKKKMLFKSLNVDEEGNSIEIEKTINSLQELLKREAIKRNYPKQDIEALQLQPKYDSIGNVVDIQFNIPLWLSPNSNRYESLLNAIISNKLVNIKLPGNSYVVGSEAGFKIQSDLKGINQNNIVFTSNFEKELKSDQIFLPSKFRDNNGNLIQFIDENGNPNPIYTERDTNGSLKLKENMIDNQLLNITSFRIPTSSHVSMSQLKIAGFLPTEVGDLMIIPKNLIKQKGLDFDIDKETTYQLHTFVDDTGKISVLNEKAKQKLLKAADTKGTNMLTDKSAETKLIKVIFGDDPDFKDEELNDKSFLSLLNNKLKTKLYENELIKIHSSVLSNPNIQKKINKTLSVDFAKLQAQLIQNEIKSDDKHFTILSDTYQKNKIFSGASGKSGIGVYSNYIVFHSMVQQSKKPIQLLQYEKDGNKVPLEIQIGNQISNGLLGNKQSLAPKKLQRSIAEIFAERQNTATDNAKEEIMGKVNVNKLTINVDCLLSALGFDKDILDDGREVSIPYLFLSQPIIKEYVEKIGKIQSNTTEFEADAKEKVIKELKNKYEIEEEYNTEKVSSLLTGQTLFDNLTKTNKLIQLEVFKTFLKLDNYTKSIGLLQSKLNINRSGLGKSFFDTIDKYYKIQNIIEDNENNKKSSIIKNASTLVGNYVQNNEDVTENRKQKLLDDGYVLIGDYYIKPDNPVGSMLVNAIQTAYNLWKDYFPYNDRNVKSVSDEILSEITDESTSFQKVIEMRQDIFKEMKKYFMSSERLGTFEGNPQIERNRLFIDTDENESLANYLRRINIKRLISNKLLSRFQFEINKNGIPSLIKFDNTKGENFDEDYLYISLIELMDQNIKLPDYNGEEYSTGKLARDLIAYSYLEGGIQQAIQFVKYIPVSYLNILPFASITREWNSNYRYNIFGNILGLNESKDNISRFSRQYIQHNPQRLFKINPETQIRNSDYNGSKIGELQSLTSFELNLSKIDNVEFAKLDNTSFVTIYNPKLKNGLKNFQIYEKIGKTEYKRISTLGIFGMSEYSLKETDVHSIVNDYYKATEPVKKPIKTEKINTDIFNIKTNTVSEIINDIANYDFIKYQHLQPVAKSLIPFINNNITIEVNDIVNSKGQRIGRGKYSTKQNKITIDTQYYNTAKAENLAKTIIHELIHALSANYIGEYVDDNGKYKQSNPPQEIQKLVILFNETKKKLGPEIEKYAKKRKDQLLSETSEATTIREKTVAYGGTNIKEFVTLIMTEPNFQKEMMNIKYKSTNKNLFDKFTEIINNIMQKLFGNNYDVNNVTYEGIKTSLEIIEKQASQKSLSPFKQMEQNDMAAEDILNKNFDDTVLEPNERGEKNSQPENSIFENPFPCK